MAQVINLIINIIGAVRRGRASPWDLPLCRPCFSSWGGGGGFLPDSPNFLPQRGKHEQVTSDLWVLELVLW